MLSPCPNSTKAEAVSNFLHICFPLFSKVSAQLDKYLLGKWTNERIYEKWSQVNKGFEDASHTLGFSGQEFFVGKKQKPSQTNVKWKK